MTSSGPTHRYDRSVGRDADLILDVIDELGRRATGTPPEGLGHPLIVRARLREHMDELTEHGMLVPTGFLDRLLGKLGFRLPEEQRRVNQAVLESLHQLDHRARLQEEETRAVEQDLRRLEHRVGDVERRLSPG